VKAGLGTVAAENAAVLLKVADHPDYPEGIYDRLREVSSFLQFRKVVPPVQKTNPQVLCKVVNPFAFAKRDDMFPHPLIVPDCLPAIMETV